MKTQTNRIILLILLVVLFTNIKAQTNKLECQKKLDEAKSLYGQGLFIDTEQLLKETTNNCNFDWISKQDAWELLLKVLLELDKIHEADSIRYLILKQDPNYELKENGNPEEFNRFMKQIDVHPLFSIGLRNVLTHQSLLSTQTNFILEDVDYNAPYVITSPEGSLKNFRARLYFWMEYEFKKSFSINLELTYFTLSYSRLLQKNSDWRLSYSEQLNFIEAPLYLKKYIPITRNIIPYVAAGAAQLQIINATANASIDYQTNDPVTGTVFQHPNSNSDINVLNMRNRFSYELLVGTGIGYRFKNLCVYLDYRKYIGLNSLSNQSNRFNNSSPLITQYYYIDNSFKINKYEIGLSFTYTLMNKLKLKIK